MTTATARRVNIPGKPVEEFTAGLVIKLTETLPATSPGKRTRTVKAGTVLVISAPFSTATTAGWAWTADGYCLAIQGNEATAWDFHTSEHDRRCNRDLCHSDCPIRRKRRIDDHA